MKEVPGFPKDVSSQRTDKMLLNQNQNLNFLKRKTKY